jgi:hypothetical protein
MNIAALAWLAVLAGCAGGSVGIGAPYIVSEGEQPIRPGMTSSDVIQRLGHPYYQFGVRQEDATVWNYRMRYGSCLIYQVSMLPNGIVKDAGTAQDPACDRPERRRW